MEFGQAKRESQRTVERYLEALYEAGLACREQMTAPGKPWGYWCEEELRQKVLSKISISEGDATNSDRFTTKSLCRKYMAEKSSDSLKDSIKEFFSNSDIIGQEMYRGIWSGSDLLGGDPESLYLSLFSLKKCRNSENAPVDCG